MEKNLFYSLACFRHFLRKELNELYVLDVVSLLSGQKHNSLGVSVNESWASPLWGGRLT